MGLYIVCSFKSLTSEEEIDSMASRILDLELWPERASKTVVDNKFEILIVLEASPLLKPSSASHTEQSVAMFGNLVKSLQTKYGDRLQDKGLEKHVKYCMEKVRVELVADGPIVKTLVNGPLEPDSTEIADYCEQRLEGTMNFDKDDIKEQEERESSSERERLHSPGTEHAIDVAEEDLENEIATLEKQKNAWWSPYSLFDASATLTSTRRIDSVIKRAL